MSELHNKYPNSYIRTCCLYCPLSVNLLYIKCEQNINTKTLDRLILHEGKQFDGILFIFCHQKDVPLRTEGKAVSEAKTVN